jgi:hypothetical protein
VGLRDFWLGQILHAGGLETVLAWTRGGMDEQELYGVRIDSSLMSIRISTSGHGKGFP